MKYWWNGSDRQRPKYLGKMSHIFTASTTNPAWSGIELGLLEPLEYIYCGSWCGVYTD